ncbi:MAG: hypothetical protein JKY56_14280, partial [Kofleriaceae bacterium]|nr:hypothetical protein [Kofleriaceae bacterium]
MDLADDDQENDSRVDELIDRGLERYGNGELAAALADWKHAQALSPTCDRVREYIKLVESHYELSSSNEIEDGNDAEDGEELTIDRSLNSAPPAIDEGWDIDDDWSDDDSAGQADSNDDPVESLDRMEPSLPEDTRETPMVTLREMSFEEEDAQAGRSVERNSQQQSVVSGEITSGASLGSEARAPITPESSVDVEDEPTKSFYLPELVDAGIELERVGNSAPAEAGELEQTQNVVRNFRDPQFELEISDDSDSAPEPEVPKSERGTLELAPLDLGGISSSAQQRPEPSPPSGLSFDDELTNFHVSLNSQ